MRRQVSCFAECEAQIKFRFDVPWRLIEETQSAAAHDGRQFCCRDCDRLVVVCRVCDCGNDYCSRECSERARVRRKREATRRYQATPKGRVKHRERQRRFRKRVQERRREQESVTHPGSGAGVVESTLEAAPQQERPTDETQQRNHETTQAVAPTDLGDRRRAPKSKPIETRGTPQEGQRPCCICARWCGPHIRTVRLALSGPRRNTPRAGRWPDGDPPPLCQGR